MWQGKRGPCNCAFCATGRPHREHGKYQRWGDRGHLQVAESLDPADITRTRICMMCTHEEVPIPGKDYGPIATS